MASLAHLKLSCHSRFIFRCRFSFPRINLKCAARFSSSNMSMFSPSRLSVFRRVSDIWMKGHSISTQHQHLLSDIQSILDVVEVQRDFPALRSKLIDFHEQLCRENVWENLVTAQSLSQEYGRLKNAVEEFDDLCSRFVSFSELLTMADTSKDFAIYSEALLALQGILHSARQMKLRSLLNGRFDGCDCWIEIVAGAGGDDSADWVTMLQRMYMGYAVRRGFDTLILEQTRIETGLRQTSFRVSGEFAYGWLRTESGIHRLVRISPFDIAARRHTSFASVSVYPIIIKDLNIDGTSPRTFEGNMDFKQADLNIETFRSSGAGGQHVNKTDTAVRITHRPSGIVVQCQNERSQVRNKATALQMLHSRLALAEENRQAKIHTALRSTLGKNSFGAQIRSYVLNPYTLVKDLRTSMSSPHTSLILSGDIDAFIEQALLHNVKHKLGDAIDDLL